MEPFIAWLNRELDDRGWPRAEAARRGGISESMFSKVIGGFANPGIDFCRGVSRAFGVPMEDVFRLAGILPARPAVRARRIVYEVDMDEQLLMLWRALTPEDQALVRDLLERLQPKTRIIGDE